jgi:Lipoprotein LpqB beta-propeller domain
MGAMGVGRRLLQYGLLPVCAVALVAGCSSMPSSGEVRKVGDGQRADADSQVRVFSIPPSPGESPSDIVSGFLEATTSGETDFATAKKYLSKDEAAQWDPFSKITVLPTQARSHEDANDSSRKDGYAAVTLSGTKEAVVDTKHAYQPDQGPYAALVQLVRQDNQWRIDGLPDGLVLSQPDFQRIYHSVNMYYFARLGQEAADVSGAAQTLVADPVYLRNQVDPLVSTVSALLGGPSDWLAPVVASAAPAKARLDDKAADHGVTLDDSQRLKVRLDSSGNGLRGQRCTELAAQLFATVQAQASAKLTAAEVDRTDGSTACVLQSDEAQLYTSQNLVGNSPQPYYIGADSQHQLMELADDRDKAKAVPVTGPFGAAKADLDSVAVRRNQQEAAGVRADGHELVVGSIVDDRPLGQPLVKSTASSPKDGLSAPSWDGLGDLWVADRNPAAPRLLVLHDGAGTPIGVSVPGLAGRIQSLRVASDGVRIALVVQQGKVSQLQLGRIVRKGPEQHPKFSVTHLRALTPSGEDVTSVSWAGSSRLVVLDTEQGGAQQIEYMSTDGSAGTALQGVSQASTVAASEDQSKSLLASYDSRVYRLPSGDANWKQISPKGGSPVYPG